MGIENVSPFHDREGRKVKEGEERREGEGGEGKEPKRRRIRIRREREREREVSRKGGMMVLRSSSLLYPKYSLTDDAGL